VKNKLLIIGGIASAIIVVLAIYMSGKLSGPSDSPEQSIKQFYAILLKDDYEAYRTFMNGNVQIDEASFRDYAAELQRAAFKRPTFERELNLGNDLLVIGDQDDWHHVFQFVDGAYAYLGIDQETYPIKFRYDSIASKAEINERYANPLPVGPPNSMDRDQALALIDEYRKDPGNEELALEMLAMKVEDPALDKEALDQTVYYNFMIAAIRAQDTFKALYYGDLAFDGTDAGSMAKANWSAYIYLLAGHTGKALALYQANANQLPGGIDEQLYTLILYSESHADAVRKVQGLGSYSLEYRDLERVAERGDEQREQLASFSGQWISATERGFGIEFTFVDRASGVMTYGQEGSELSKDFRYELSGDAQQLSIVLEDEDIVAIRLVDGDKLEYAGAMTGTRHTLVRANAASVSDPLQAADSTHSLFEGQWGTAGSDELAFRLAFDTDRTGTIAFISEGEEYPSAIEFTTEGQRLLYHYEGMNEITVLELQGDNEMIVEDSSGYRVTVQRVDDLAPQDEGQSKASPPFYAGLWQSDTGLRLRIEHDGADDAGKITFYGQDGYEATDTFRTVEADAGSIVLLLDDEDHSRIMLEQASNGLRYSIEADGGLSSDGTILLTRENE